MLETKVDAARIGTDGWIVSAAGELDLHAAPLLKRELESAVAGGAKGVIVDLAAVTFIDSTVLGVLLGARARLARIDAALVLVSADPRVVRVLEITGLDRLFRVEPSLRDAVAVVLAAPANAA